MRRTKFPAPGSPLRVFAGLNTMPGPHSSSRVPAACCGSGISLLNPTTWTQSPCREDLVRADVLAVSGGNFLKHKQALKELLHHPDSKWRGLSQKPMQVLMSACAHGNHSTRGTLHGMQLDVWHTWFILHKPLSCTRENTHAQLTRAAHPLLNPQLGPQGHGLPGRGKPVQQSLAPARW